MLVEDEKATFDALDKDGSSTVDFETVCPRLCVCVGGQLLHIFPRASMAVAASWAVTHKGGLCR
jgi:hypothetical protein